METSDVQEEIVEAADALGLIAPDLGSGKGKAYEAWVLFEIAVKLMERGYGVLPCGPSETVVNAFRLRGSPGGMPDAATPASADPPSHFVLEGNLQSLEMHIGVQVRGISGASHEVDVSVLPRELGRTCRRNGGGIFQGPLSHGLELQAYDAQFKLSQVMPRALLGVALDLDPTWALVQVVYRTQGGGERSFSPIWRTSYGLLTTTLLYENSRSLLQHHGVIIGEQVLPGQNEQAVERVVDEIAQLLGAPIWPAT